MPTSSTSRMSKGLSEGRSVNTYGDAGLAKGSTSPSRSASPDHSQSRCSVTGKTIKELLDQRSPRRSQSANEPSSWRPPRRSVADPNDDMMLGDMLDLPPTRRTRVLFDADTAMEWIDELHGKVVEQLPPEVREEHFDDAIGSSGITLSQGSNAVGCEEFRVTSDIIKKLFATFDELHAMSHDEGCTLAGKTLEAILKLRSKRVQASLLGGHLSSVIRVLSVIYPSLDRPRRERSHLSAFDFSENLRETCSQASMLDDLVAAIVAPCDEETFAGVIRYTEKVNKNVAEQVVRDQVIENIAQTLRELDQGDTETALAYWRTMFEAISYCADFLPSSRPLVHALTEQRIMGLICHALVMKPPADQSCQRFAAMTFHKLAQDPNCLASMVATAINFPQSWDYLIPPLYTGDAAVETEVAAALEQFLEKGNEELHDAIFESAARSFAMAVIHSADSTATIRVATNLSRSETDVELTDHYVAFHETVIRASMKRLDMGIAAKGQIPLIQYLDRMLELHVEQFAPLMVEHGMVAFLKSRVDASRRRGGGVLMGVCNQPLCRLREYLEA